MLHIGCSLTDPLAEKCGGKADYTIGWLITIIICVVIILITIVIIIIIIIIKKEMEKRLMSSKGLRVSANNTAS